MAKVEYVQLYRDHELVKRMLICRLNWTGSVLGKWVSILVFVVWGFACRGWGIVLSFPLIFLSILRCLTIVRDFISPVDHSSLAKLFASTIAWTTIFFFSTIRILYLIWRKRVVKSGLMNFIPRISREEAVVCVCFGLVNVLAAAVNEFGGTL